MSVFPIDKLNPISGRIEGVESDASITIDIHPFSLQIYEGEGAEKIITSLRLSSVKLPTLDIKKLQNRAYKFPLNSHEDHIDGSIYVEHAHHPVDVNCLKFGSFDGSLIGVDIRI